MHESGRKAVTVPQAPPSSSPSKGSASLWLSSYSASLPLSPRAPGPRRPDSLTCACRCVSPRQRVARPAPTRGAPASGRLPRRCQPRSRAWVWDRAARGTRAAQRRAGRREGGNGGAGSQAGTALSPWAPDRRRSEDAQGTLGAEEPLPRTQPPPSREEELASEGPHFPLCFAPQLTTHPAGAEGPEPRADPRRLESDEAQVRG